MPHYVRHDIPHVTPRALPEGSPYGMPHYVRHDKGGRGCLTTFGMTRKRLSLRALLFCHPERSEGSPHEIPRRPSLCSGHLGMTRKGVPPSPSFVTPNEVTGRRPVIPSEARDPLVRFLGVLRFAQDTSEWQEKVVIPSGSEGSTHGMPHYVRHDTPHVTPRALPEGSPHETPSRTK